MRVQTIILSLGMFFSIGCKKEGDRLQEIECDGSTRTYQDDIKTIIDANCVSCHNEYGDYVGVKNSVDNGSFEREVITNQTMPRGGDLTPSELTKIRCWLEQGAPEN